MLEHPFNNQNIKNLYSKYYFLRILAVFVLIYTAVLIDIQAISLQQYLKSKKRRPGVILYKFKKGVGQTTMAGFNKFLLKNQSQTPKRFAAKQSRLARSRICLKHFALNGKKEEDICRDLLATGAVEYAEPDYLMKPVAVPNDPGYNSQWHHTTLASSLAWNITTGSNAVTVAVCDSGVESSHGDLSANLLPGYNTADFPASTNSSPITDHGTMVAGCIGAIGNNSVGATGVAWEIKILPIRITNDSEGWAYYTDMAEAITWAADQGVKIVNLSYGGFHSSTVIAAADYLRGKGGLLFMAAGNEGTNMTGWPDPGSIILVGATDSNDQRASFSNYGSPVDMVAPGQEITTTTTVDGYAEVNGTSFASPITAAIAALILSYNGPTSPDVLESVLSASCVDLGATGEDSTYGHGRISAYLSLIPKSSAGSDKTVYKYENIQLDGSAIDQLLPSPEVLTKKWELISGPTAVVFQDANTDNTTVSFSADGEYVFRLTCSDTITTVTDDVTLTVLKIDPQLSHIVENDYTNGISVKYANKLLGGGKFNFKVNYKDALGGFAPDVIQVWIDNNSDGKYDDLEKYDLTGSGDNYKQDVTYQFIEKTLSYDSITLKNGILKYCFYASTKGLPAGGISANEYEITFKTNDLPGDRSSAAGPSPFNPAEEETRIVFKAESTSEVNIFICDLSGKLVWQKKENVNKGNSFMTWNGKNAFGIGIASGVYFCRVIIRPESGGEVKVHNHKIVVLRK